MNIKEASELIKKCGGHPRAPVCQGHGWCRIFIQDSRGVQIGRLTFHQDKLEYIKSYKRDYYRSVDETDLIFLRFHKAVCTGIFISEIRFWGLWEQARQEVEKDLKEKQARRKVLTDRERQDFLAAQERGVRLPARIAHRLKNGLPPKKRKRLEGKNPRRVFCQLIAAE